tara:strand:+ start:924 stop:1112 length:189 start_codon:yes stop_codon:yes gene_type:complete
MKNIEKPNGIMMLEALLKAGKIPEKVVLVNTKEKEEVIYNVEDCNIDDDEREEYLKDLPFGD